MQTSTPGRRYLTDFLKIAPLSHALWRSAEALAFEGMTFDPPVLDIGCGFGEFAGVVFGRIEVGIDINEKDVKKAATGDRYLKVMWADARNLPFASSSISSALSVSVLEHIPEPESVINEVYRVLKSGGAFVLTVPTSELSQHLLVPAVCRAFGLDGVGDWYFRLHCRVFKHVSLQPTAWWHERLVAAGLDVTTAKGTVSPTLAKLHEFFLLSAFPSQLWKILFGRRLIISVGLRSKLLPVFFGRYVEPDDASDINVLFVARKP